MVQIYIIITLITLIAFKNTFLPKVLQASQINQVITLIKYTFTLCNLFCLYLDLNIFSWGFQALDSV